MIARTLGAVTERKIMGTTTTYEIGHDALAGKIDAAGIKAAIRKHPSNRAEILIAATTEALETGRAKLALQMLKAAAGALDGPQPNRNRGKDHESQP